MIFIVCFARKKQAKQTTLGACPQEKLLEPYILKYIFTASRSGSNGEYSSATIPMALVLPFARATRLRHFLSILRPSTLRLEKITWNISAISYSESAYSITPRYIHTLKPRFWDYWKGVYFSHIISCCVTTVLLRFPLY